MKLWTSGRPWVVLLIAGAAIAFGWGLFHFHVATVLVVTLDQARDAASTRARVLREHAEQAFAAAAIALRALDDRPDLPGIQARRDHHDNHLLLRRLRDSSQIFIGIGLVDRDGNVVASADRDPPAAVNLSDRDYFAAHREDPQLGLLISAPVVSRPGNELTIPVSRRLDDSAGNFNGVIAARLASTYFQAIYRSAGAGAVVLLRADGVHLASATAAERGSTRAGTTQLDLTRGLPASGEGTVEAQAADNGIWLVGYSYSSEYPVAVAVALDKADLLASWREQRNILLVVAFLSTVAIMTLVALLLRRLRLDALMTDALRTSRDDADAARSAAEAATNRLQTLIEASPLAIVEVDRNRHLCLWNAAAEKIFGWRAEEVLGRELPNIPEDRKGELSLVLQAWSNGAPLQALETRRVRKDGSLIDVTVWTAPRRDASGAIIGMIGIATDTSEQKRLQEHLRQTQRLEAVGQLTGGVAHEFNNLLQVILGNLEILDEMLHGQREAEQLVKHLARAGQRGAQLTHQLLAFSRKQPLQPVSFSPKEELVAVEALVRAAVGAEHTIRVEVPDDVSPALADTNQLNNAVLNLVLNARDATPDGGAIVIRARNVVLADDRARDLDVAPGRYVAIEVIDTGTGMSPEVVAHAIEPFFTTKEVGKGTGLGLSMVHGFVKQSGGGMEIVSELGKGTTVRLLLPITADAAGSEVGLRKRWLVPVRNVTVLVVEDEPDVLDLAVTMLRSLGFGVIHAADGPTALAALQKVDRVDVLFTDVILPKGMSGRDLARLAQAHRPNLKVIYTSGYNENVIIHEGKLDEGVMLLRKPYSREDLLLAIEKATQDEASAARRPG